MRHGLLRHGLLRHGLLRNRPLVFVGYRTVELGDASGLTTPMVVMYPTEVEGRSERIGPYSLDVALDAPPLGGDFPLVLISHGSGGSPLLYRTLARYLASAGFVVGLPEHPFNNRNDDAWAGTLRNLRARPAVIRSALDWFFADSEFAASLRPGVAAVVGHSLGAYAALAAAGGIATSFPRESEDGQVYEIATPPDPRIKALVLLAPATVWFAGDAALRKVAVPILMLSAERDELTRTFHAQIVIERLPDLAQIRHRVVENAGHFSFLSPFPDAMSRPGFRPAQDPPGFDRARFHDELNAEIAEFLQRELHAPEPVA